MLMKLDIHVKTVKTKKKLRTYNKNLDTFMVLPLIFYSEGNTGKMFRTDKCSSLI